MNRKDILKDLFKKYDFSKPLPEDQKRRLHFLKKSTLVGILKKKKKYFAFMALIVSLFFWIRRFGISLSLSKCAIAVLTVISIATGVAAAGTFYAVKLYVFEKDAEEKELQKQHNENSIQKKESDTVKQNITADYKISVMNLDYDEDIAQIGKEINSTVINELIRLKGSDTIALIEKNRGNIPTRKILTGSIVKLNSSYRITAKIIDKRTSRVLFYIHENTSSDDDIAGACKEISKKIADKI